MTQRLFVPVDILPLVFFRVAFGGVMLWEVWRYFNFDRIARYFVEPTFWFHYYGFHWVTPLPGDGMFALFHLLGALSVLILLGAFYRVSVAVFWLCFTYVFLLDQAQYLNHFYFVTLVSFLLIFVPAHRALSVDALLRPRLRAQVAPAWTLWLLRGQLAVVYFFGGIAKLNADWLAGEPMREWLSYRTDFPLIGPLFTEGWMVYAFVYGGLLFDLLVVPLLLWRRTRLLGLALAVGFHVTNARLFNIGIFPWFSIAMTLLFLPPGWFRVPVRWFGGQWRRLRGVDGAARSVPPGDSPVQPALKPPTPHYRRLVLVALALWFGVQILLPLRHVLFPGDPSWSEEGHTLAWHMRLRDKDGSIAFFASDPASGTIWEIPARTHLSSRQWSQMSDNPHMIQRFAHHLARQLAADGYPQAQVYAWSMMSLNSRAPQLLIDPTADLAHEPDTLRAKDWILPLLQPPVPGHPVPALLVSRRHDGALVLVNVAESVYILDRLHLSTPDGGTLAGPDFGVPALRPGECVIAHQPDADLRALLPACDESGARLALQAARWDAPLTVATATGRTHTCDSVACVVDG